MSKYKIFRTHDGENIIGKIVDSNRVSFLVNRPMKISISTIGICDDMEKEMTHRYDANCETGLIFERR